MTDEVEANDLLTKYEDALRFYADPRTYKLRWSAEGAEVAIETDEGARAREALNGL